MAVGRDEEREGREGGREGREGGEGGRGTEGSREEVERDGEVGGGGMEARNKRMDGRTDARTTA